MFTLDDTAFGIVFARLDPVVRGRIDFEAVLLSLVVDLAHIHVLQGDDATGLLVLLLTQNENLKRTGRQRRAALTLVYSK